MTTHVLWQADVADFDAWYKVFKDDFPSRKATGIRKQNIWRDPEHKNHAIVLFKVHDIEKARVFFASEEMAMHRERGGIAHVSVAYLDDM